MSVIRKAIASCSAIVLWISLSACGLESIVYLNPPEPVSFSSVPPNAVFRKTLDNGDISKEPGFRGFELYYKIYPDTDTDINITDRDTLLTKGFFRIASEDDREGSISMPLFFVPLSDRGGKEFDITVDFSTLPNPEVKAADPSTTEDFTIRRGVVYIEGPYIDQFKHFDKDEFELEDADMTEDVYNSIQNSQPVYLVLYALSYGKKDIFIDIYSVSVFIGQIQITFD